MFWITLETNEGQEFLDVVYFVIRDGEYFITLIDGNSRRGNLSDIVTLHVESVKN